MGNKTGPKPRYEKDGGADRISVYISANNKTRLQEYAVSQQASPSEVVNELLNRFFAQVGR